MRIAIARPLDTATHLELEAAVSETSPGPLSVTQSATRRSVVIVVCAMCVVFGLSSFAGPAEALFRYGTNSYYFGDYTQSAGAFAQAASMETSGGTLQNLGNAEWQRGRTGAAILAWEQSLWLDPFSSRARSNLRFARRAAQLESPELSWYEVVSSWLPANWWAWVAGFSLWSAVGISSVPGMMRWRKAAWHQATAALGLAIFLLSVPAHLGVHSRARLGFIMLKDTPLRLTPTSEAQFITRLPAGEPGRLERQHGRYILIHTGHTVGWVERSEFKLICSPPGEPVAGLRAQK